MPGPAAIPLDVPILGQAAKPHGCAIAIPVTCACRPEGVLLIEGLGGSAVCPGCAGRYFIAGLTWDYAARHLNINIGIARVVQAS